MDLERANLVFSENEKLLREQEAEINRLTEALMRERAAYAVRAIFSGTPPTPAVFAAGDLLLPYAPLPNEHFSSILSCAVFCREAVKQFEIHAGQQLTFFDYVASSLTASPESQETDTVSYVKNLLTDDALALFSPLLSQPQTMNAPSFSASCEDVFYGHAKYCILPLSDTNSGKLTAFYSMMNKFDLKIAATAFVLSEEVTTLYALLGRQYANLTVPDANAGQMLEFTLTQQNEDSIPHDLLFAVSYFNAVLTRVDALPLSYTASAFEQCFVADVKSALLFPFLTYLSLYIPNRKILGFYPQIAPA